MTDRLTIHIVDRDSAARARLARSCFALGHHAEVYEALAELIDLRPQHGLLFLRDDQGVQGPAGRVAFVQGALEDAGFWLPVVALSERPDTASVVNAIKHGALDYLAADVTGEDLAVTLARLAGEVERQGFVRRRIVEARRSLRTLSKREREVLDCLARGLSNKAIARELGISPRTVEIHRANMMGKLGAGHPADAVRLRLEAQLEGEMLAA